MKKISFILIIVLCAISVSGCFGRNKPKYYEKEVIWYSENPDIVFSTQAYQINQYMTINGITKNIFISHVIGDGGWLYINDADLVHYMYDEEVQIWECDVQWRSGSDTLRLKVVKDNVFGYEGQTITFKSKPIPEEHTMPSDCTVLYSYKNAASLVRKLNIPEEIKCVFEDSDTCCFETEKITLSDLGKIEWRSFYEYDINSDGNNELFVTICDKEYALIMFSVIEDEVRLDYIVKEDMREMYEGGIIRLGDGFYKIEIASDRKILLNKITNNNDDYFYLKSYGIRY